MGRNRLAMIFAALLVALLALPALSHAARGDDVIRDCHEDGTIDGNYSQGDYQEAQENLPSDVDQYGDCRDVIRQAQADGSRGRRSGGGSGVPGFGGGGGGGGAAGGGGFGSLGGDVSRRGGSPKPYEGDPALETPSGAYASSQEDKAAYDDARANAARGGALPGGLSIPAAGDFKPANAGGIPLPILLALISVGLLAAATSVLVARKRLPALTRVTSRFRRG